MDDNSCGSCSSDNSLPYTTNDAGGSCDNPPDDGGGCAYCSQGQSGLIPVPGSNTDYCGGAPFMLHIPVCPF